MMFLKLISLSLALHTANAVTYSLKGCYSFDDLESYLTSKGEYTFQTNGYCEGQCAGSSVAATLNGATCYCGDELPSSISSVSASNCDTPCQGYDTEICGGNGYISVYTDGQEETGDSSASDGSSSSSGSSTKSGSSSKSSSSTAQTSSSSTTTTTGTSTSQSQAKTTSQTTSTGTTSTAASTSIQVITSVISGSEAVITATQTVIPSSTSTSTSDDSNTSSSASSSSDSNSDSDSDSDSEGLSKGAIAGIAVGSVIGVFAIIGLIVGCFWYIRRQNDDDDDDDENALDESGSSIAHKFNSEKPIHNDFFYGSQMNTNNNPMSGFQNPNAPFFSFDEVNGHKRLSNGSLPDARHEKTLRVVNPDDELNDTTLKHDDDGHMTDDSDDSDWRK